MTKHFTPKRIESLIDVAYFDLLYLTGPQRVDPIFNPFFVSTGRLIVDWYEQHGRDLPWRETRDPYRIWVAEVILQQTRIEQGVGYFYRFMERFPNVQALAEAQQDEVLKYWEGLGYYSRARNLHRAAQMVVEQYDGQFPNDHRELIKLKGIGPYTARAVGSFAFDNPVGVIDGNVLRVMARLMGDSSPINQQATRKRFQEVIDQWVEGVASRPFNFGIMDLGSTVCTPTQPGCLICPLQHQCEAYRQGLTHLLPHKAKKLKRKTQYLHFYLVEDEEGRIAIQQRPEEGIWGGLWEIPNQDVPQEQWLAQEDAHQGRFLMEFKHVLTHLDLMIQVYRVPLSQAPEFAAHKFIPPSEIPIFAFAKAVLKIFDRWKTMA